MKLTRGRLQRLLRYNPRTGIFTWRVDGRNQYVRRGKIAGCLDPDGRIKIRIEGTLYLASRLAVLYMTGRWPPNHADHRNLDQANNRWSNLRLATGFQNNGNIRMKKKNRVGFKGVVLHQGRYKAQIGLNGGTKYLGMFDTAAAANAAYAAAAKKYFGEFARAS